MKKKKPVKENVKKPVEKAEKAYVMRTTKKMQILRTLLWIMVSFIFLRGVISCLHPDKTSEINRLINEFKTEYYDTQDTDYEVLAFAQNFIMEYLTYDIAGNESFANRIKPYVSKKVASIEDVYNFKNSCEATYCEAYKIREMSDSQVDVFVKAKVKYNIQELQEDNTYKSKTIIKQVILKVPVYISDSGYVVEDLPVFVNDSMLGSDYEINDITLEEVDSEPYEVAVENFLKAYYGDDQGVLDYFISSDADASKFRCLGGSFEYSKIDKLTTYKEDGILCIVSFMIIDTTNNVVLRQQLNLKLVNSENRLYVRDIATRTGNI